MSDHDGLYHQIFSHPGMVAQLLREFVAEPWLDQLDLDHLERLNAKFHADSGERREGDVIWRIPLRSGGDAYLMLLLEFQSKPDRYMALRVMVYAGLLWQHLEKEKRLPADGRLPPILPIVLYNGEPRWAMPLSLQDLIGLPKGSTLWPWQPQMRYHIIDEGAYSEEDLAGRDDLGALLFLLEASPDPQKVVALTGKVISWFERHPDFERLKPVFAAFLSGMIEPLESDSRVPEDLWEILSMLAARAKRWKEEWLQEGREEGLEEGLEKGRQEGLKKGLERGFIKGEAALLIRLLERRFGTLPGWAGDRIDAADKADLEEWSLRVLEAGSLEDILR